MTQAPKIYFQIRFTDTGIEFRYQGDKKYFEKYCGNYSGKVGFFILKLGGISRSLRQNAFFHSAVIDAFIELSGETNRIFWKSNLKQMFLTEHLENGKEYTKATSDLSVREMSEFIQKCLDYLADNGGCIPDSESWREWEQIK